MCTPANEVSILYIKTFHSLSCGGLPHYSWASPQHISSVVSWSLQQIKIFIPTMIVLPSGCAKLYYYIHAQLFQQSELMPPKEHNVSITKALSLTSVHTSQRTWSLSACMVTMVMHKLWQQGCDTLT